METEMGRGYKYKCRNCGKQSDILLGIGGLYPQVYKGFVEEIREGEYGEEFKRAFEETTYAVIDPERKLYVCDNCGSWGVAECMSVYAPNDPEKIAEEKYGEKTVGELGYVPYVSSYEVKEKYHLVKEDYIECPKCGRAMRVAEEEDMKSLPCPECGTQNGLKEGILWD